jgi:hypothetical protein
VWNTIAYTNGDCDRDSHGNCNSHSYANRDSHSHCNGYANSYADTYAEACSNTEASSHATASPISEKWLANSCSDGSMSRVALIKFTSASPPT